MARRLLRYFCDLVCPERTFRRRVKAKDPKDAAGKAYERFIRKSTLRPDLLVVKAETDDAVKRFKRNQEAGAFWIEVPLPARPTCAIEPVEDAVRHNEAYHQGVTYLECPDLGRAWENERSSLPLGLRTFIRDPLLDREPHSDAGLAPVA